ncbi:N-acetylneuraminate lyase isoform X2 [Amblyraja radiata]|uniref:N-acetylneuraminate lyase isoform X2 n=2 Tax=Amblyraja radiata TaxID=386614 RepID=UPI001402024D|nr:N-acetylneuraminate lyase isoform X2 [Amblyraja radiata]
MSQRGDVKMSSKRLSGLVAATFTPLTNDDEINLPVIGPYIDYLVKVQGIRNIFVNGTTGEGMSLSVEERKLVAEEWINKGKGKLDHVIIHVGSLSIKESRQMAEHAAKCNASGIAVISPFFFKPQSTDALVEYLKEVASAAPGIPFYYYHLPELTGVSFRVVELLDGIEKKIPTFRGLKFTSSDLLDFGQCVNNYKDKFDLLYGKDELLLSAMVLGATGAVGSTYNYFGNLNKKMLSYFEKQDYNLAREQQAIVQEFIGYVSSLGFGVAENKATMMLVSGIPLGPPRLPLLKCSEEKKAQILAKLKILGLLN